MVLRTLLLGFAIISVIPTTTHAQAQSEPAATSKAPSTNSASADAIKQANAAIDKAATALSQAKDALDKAGKYQKAIQDITGSTAKSSQSELDNLQTLQATIDAINQNRVLTALTTAQDDLDKSKTGKPEAAVHDACSGDKLKQPATGEQPDITSALAKCDAAERDADSTLAAATKALTALQSALQSISPYIAKQFDNLAANLQPFTDANLISAGGSAEDATTPKGGGGAAAQQAAAAPANAPSDASATKKPAAPASGPSPTVLLQVLPKGLPALQQVLQNAREYKAAWTAIKPTVDSESAGKKPAPSTADASATAASDKSKDAAPAKNAAPEADAELQKLQDSVNSIQASLAAWFAAISDQLQADSQKLDSQISGVASDPAKNSAAALGDVRDETDTLASVQSIVDAWPPLVGFLVDGQPKGFSLGTVRKNFEDLQKWTNILRASISRVHDALAGDFTDFETDQVSLYYFSDIPRLMYALNDRFQTMGGVAEAKAQADAQRIALTQTELDLADAQATVNRYQKQVLDLQEQQRQAGEKLKGLNSNLSKLASRLKQAQDAKQTADQNVTTATQNQQASTTSTNSATGPATTPPDPTLAADVEKAKAKQTAAAANLSNAQSNYDAAKTERDSAQSQADDTQNQKDSLPAKLAAAQQSLSDAQTSVSQQRRKMLLAAQAESDAFAFARDNTPFLFAPADASSPDPAKRVILYAFNDSKTVFMRGKPDDLSVVKHTIAVFDKPAPQARLTLWTFQLSTDSGQKTDRKSAERLNKSMSIVDQELGDTRALENTTLALLRDVINDQVTTFTTRGACLSGYHLTPPDCEKLKRITFYDPSVLAQLSFDSSDLDPAARPGETTQDAFYRTQQCLARLRKLIPDPADTTTLGEALLVLSLASPATKESVRLRFEQEVKDRLPRLPLVSTSWPPNGRADGPILPLTWHALNIWGDASPTMPQFSQMPGLLSSSQLEIVRALRASYDSSVLYDILNKIQSWSVELGGRSACPAVPPKCPSDAGIYSRLIEVEQQLAEVINRGKAKMPKEDAASLQALELKPGPLLHDDALKEDRLEGEAIKLLSPADKIAFDDLDRERLSLQSRLKTIWLLSVPVVKTLRTYGIDAYQFLPTTPIPASGSGEADTSTKGAPPEISGAKGDAQSQADLASTQAIIAQQSVARIKQQILNYSGLSTAAPRVAAADQMLKEFIIAVEDDLSREFVQPMIDRLRIKLMSTGVGVGVIQRESLLATNRGVARIDPRASAQLAVGDQEDILTGIQQLAQIYATVQSGGALAALGALQQQPREPQPEIYALNTGNKFQVTPVFDPSGQALRFKFDFVATANVQEPNGTTNTQLSRIERHTVNTEVQLSNLETREISRFEVNARLGLPTTYWGGIPILKDIPYVRPWVPLVGWFVRKGGSNASAQQSVIFGQTTIYPTIGALIDLVSEPGSVPAANQSPQETPAVRVIAP